jgi:hypothetical protein
MQLARVEAHRVLMGSHGFPWVPMGSHKIQEDPPAVIYLYIHTINIYI